MLLELRMENLNTIYDTDAWDFDTAKKEYEEIYDSIPTDEDVYSLIADSTERDLDDKKINLDIDTKEQLIAIADCSLWSGRQLGYKILKHNINSIFECATESCKFVSNGADVMSVNPHHDGTNYVLYRKIKPKLNMDSFINKLLDCRTVTERANCIKKYTVGIAKTVNNVYGWKNKVYRTA